MRHQPRRDRLAIDRRECEGVVRARHTEDLRDTGNPVRDPPTAQPPPPVDEPPNTSDSPAKDPPPGPDDGEAPVRDPRVPGQPTRKKVH